MHFRRQCLLLISTYLPEKLVEIKEQAKLSVQFLPHFFIRASSWLHIIKFLQPWVVLCRWKGMPEIPEDALVSVNVKADFDIPNWNLVVCLSEFNRLYERVRTWLHLNRKRKKVITYLYIQLTKMMALMSTINRAILFSYQPPEKWALKITPSIPLRYQMAWFNSRW